MTATERALELTRIAAQAASDKLGSDIVAFDVSEQLAITDVFLVISGRNERQVSAIVDNIEEQLAAVGAKPLRREGAVDSQWVLLDYFELVVHVQQAEARLKYSLERLWKDCPRIELQLDPTTADVSQTFEDERPAWWQ